LEPISVFRIGRAQIVLLVLGAVLFVAGSYLRNRAARGSRLSDGSLNLLLSASTLVVLLVSSEALLYVRYSANYSLRARAPIALPDDYLGHVLNPELDHSYAINSLGSRGAEFSEEKGPTEVRVVTVGNSITFGWGLYDEDSPYPAKLQSLLGGAANGRTYRVINAGVPNYTSLQALRSINERVLSLRPDLIIVCIGMADHYGLRINRIPELSFAV